MIIIETRGDDLRNNKRWISILENINSSSIFLILIIVQCLLRLRSLKRDSPKRQISFSFFSSLRINRRGPPFMVSYFVWDKGAIHGGTRQALRVKEWGYFTLGKTQFIGQIHPCPCTIDRVVTCPRVSTRPRFRTCGLLSIPLRYFCRVELEKGYHLSWTRLTRFILPC